MELKKSLSPKQIEEEISDLQNDISNKFMEEFKKMVKIVQVDIASSAIAESFEIKDFNKIYYDSKTATLTIIKEEKNG